MITDVLLTFLLATESFLALFRSVIILKNEQNNIVEML